LAVAPYHRRRGVGRALLTAAESRLRERGVTAIRLAAGVPRYLWPGIDHTNHGARALAMSAGYRLVDEAVNMSLATTFRAATPGAVTVSRVNGTGIAAVRAFVTVTWPLWGTEVDLAAARGSLFAAWDGARPVAFIAHSTMRAGWIGPMGTDDGFRGHGVGQALLSAACADLAADGWPRADIAWVGPVEYFARLGAHVNRRFLRYVKEWP
jgi:predicted N-acetyltransferase YhbS